MSKGFGQSIPQVRFISAPFMGSYDEVLLARFKGDVIVDLQSIANLLQKDIGHINKIVSSNQIPSFKVNDASVNKSRQVVCGNGFIDIVHAEIANDNPIADKFYREISSAGLKETLKYAASKGQTSIDFNGIQIDFEMIDGEPHISLSSLARMSGVSEEELESQINSPEFQRYYRSIQD